MMYMLTFRVDTEKEHTRRGYPHAPGLDLLPPDHCRYNDQLGTGWHVGLLWSYLETTEIDGLPWSEGYR